MVRAATPVQRADWACLSSRVGPAQRVAVTEVTEGEKLEAAGKAGDAPSPGCQSVGGAECLTEQRGVGKVLGDESGRQSNGTWVCKKAEKRLR